MHFLHIAKARGIRAFFLMTVIETYNLSAEYSNPVIAGLNLTVNAGDYLCITGPNGSGKTTLVNNSTPKGGSFR